MRQIRRVKNIYIGKSFFQWPLVKTYLLCSGILFIITIIIIASTTTALKYLILLVLCFTHVYS